MAERGRRRARSLLNRLWRVLKGREPQILVMERDGQVRCSYSLHDRRLAR